MTSMFWYVRSDSLGVDETIGKRLVQFFWNNLSEKLDDPATFAFMNRGVFLTLDDSPVLATLRALDPRARASSPAGRGRSTGGGVALQVIPLPAWVAADCALALRLDGTDAGRGRRSFFAARSRSGAL